jgi:hypothetical protein
MGPPTVHKTFDEVIKEIEEGVDKAFAEIENRPKAQVNDPDFPGICSRCKGPAYIGFNKTECKRGCG